jgi:hypothetical protein
MERSNIKHFISTYFSGVLPQEVSCEYTVITINKASQAYEIRETLINSP